METNDITKTGPVGLKGLTGLNLLSSVNKDSGLQNTFNKEAKTRNTELEQKVIENQDPDRLREEHNRRVTDTYAAKEVQETDFKHSRFDPQGPLTKAQVENINDIRADNQGFVSEVVNGLGKGAVTAGATFVSDIASTAMVLVDAVKFANTFGTGDVNWSNIYNNKVSRAAKNVQDWAEEAMPNYYSSWEQDHPFAINGNFIGDKLIKNSGFMVGTMASMALTGNAIAKEVGTAATKIAKGIEASKAAKLINATASSARAVEEGMALEKAAVEVQRFRAYKDAVMRANKIGEVAAAATSTTISALGEGAFEALGAIDDFCKERKDENAANKELEIQQLQQEYEQKRGQILYAKPDNMGYYDPAYEEYKKKLAEIDEKYRQLDEAVDKSATNVGNKTLALNMPILALSNALQFGHMLFGGTGKVVKAPIKNASKYGNKSITDAWKVAKAEGMSAKDFIEDYAKFEAKNQVASRAVKGVADALSEGVEEFTQGIASAYSKNAVSNMLDKRHEYSDSFEDIRQKQSMAERVFNGAMSIMETVSDNAADKDAWAEFFVGAISGAIGLPIGAKAYQGADGKMKHKVTFFDSGIGAAFKGMAQAKVDAENTAKATNEALKNMNFDDMLNGMISYQHFNDEMINAAQTGDVPKFNEYQDKALVSLVTTLDKAGRLDILSDVIDSIDPKSKDAIDYARENTEDFVGKSDEEVSEQLQRNKDTMTAAVDAFHTASSILSDLENKFDITLDQKQKDELTFMQAFSLASLARATNEAVDASDAAHNVMQSFSGLMQQVQNAGIKMDDDFREKMTNAMRVLEQIDNVPEMHRSQKKSHPLVSTAQVDIAWKLYKSMFDEAMDTLEGITTNATTKQQMQDLRDKVDSVRDNVVKSFEAAKQFGEIVESRESIEKHAKEAAQRKEDKAKQEKEQTKKTAAIDLSTVDWDSIDDADVPQAVADNYDKIAAAGGFGEFIKTVPESKRNLAEAAYKNAEARDKMIEATAKIASDENVDDQVLGISEALLNYISYFNGKSNDQMPESLSKQLAELENELPDEVTQILDGLDPDLQDTLLNQAEKLIEQAYASSAEEISDELLTLVSQPIPGIEDVDEVKDPGNGDQEYKDPGDVEGKKPAQPKKKAPENKPASIDKEGDSSGVVDIEKRLEPTYVDGAMSKDEHNALADQVSKGIYQGIVARDKDGNALPDTAKAIKDAAWKAVAALDGMRSADKETKINKLFDIFMRAMNENGDTFATTPKEVYAVRAIIGGLVIAKEAGNNSAAAIESFTRVLAPKATQSQDSSNKKVVTTAEEIMKNPDSDQDAVVQGTNSESESSHDEPSKTYSRDIASFHNMPRISAFALRHAIGYLTTYQAYTQNRIRFPEEIKAHKAEYLKYLEAVCKFLIDNNIQENLKDVKKGDPLTFKLDKELSKNAGVDVVVIYANDKPVGTLAAGYDYDIKQKGTGMNSGIETTYGESHPEIRAAYDYLIAHPDEEVNGHVNLLMTGQYDVAQKENPISDIAGEETPKFVVYEGKKQVVHGLSSSEMDEETEKTGQPVYVGLEATLKKKPGRVYVAVTSPVTGRKLLAVCKTMPLTSVKSDYFAEAVDIISKASIDNPLSKEQKATILRTLGVKGGIIDNDDSIMLVFKAPNGTKVNKVTISKEDAEAGLRKIAQDHNLNVNLDFNKLDRGDTDYIKMVSQYVTTDLNSLKTKNDTISFDFDESAPKPQAEEATKEATKSVNNIGEEKINTDEATFEDLDVEEPKQAPAPTSQAQKTLKAMMKAAEAFKKKKPVDDLDGIDLDFSDEDFDLNGDEETEVFMRKEIAPDELAATEDQRAKEVEVIKQIFPGLDDEHIKLLHKSLIKISTKKGKVEAYGRYKNGIITIAKNAPLGTAYHEAFHYVMDNLFDPGQKVDILAEAAKRYGDMSMLELEEKLAEDFRAYMNDFMDESLGGKIKRFFMSLKAIAKSILGNTKALDVTFYKMATGRQEYLKGKGNAKLMYEEYQRINNINKSSTAQAVLRVLDSNSKFNNDVLAAIKDIFPADYANEAELAYKRLVEAGEITLDKNGRITIGENVNTLINEETDANNVYAKEDGVDFGDLMQKAFDKAYQRSPLHAQDVLRKFAALDANTRHNIAMEIDPFDANDDISYKIIRAMGFEPYVHVPLSEVVLGQQEGDWLRGRIFDIAERLGATICFAPSYMNGLKGFFRPEKDKFPIYIFIDPRQFKKGIPQVFLNDIYHETIHSVFAKILGADRLGELDKLNLPQEVIDAIDSLKRAYDKFKSTAGVLENSLYGAHDVDEFLSEVFSNPTFKRVVEKVLGTTEVAKLHDDFTTAVRNKFSTFKAPGFGMEQRGVGLYKMAYDDMRERRVAYDKLDEGYRRHLDRIGISQEAYESLPLINKEALNYCAM